MNQRSPNKLSRHGLPPKTERIQISLSPLDDQRLIALCKRLELAPQALIRFLLRQAYEVLGDTSVDGQSLQLRLFPPTQPDGKTPLVIPIPKQPPTAVDA